MPTKPPFVTREVARPRRLTAITLQLAVPLIVLAFSPPATQADLIYTWTETDQQQVSGALDVSNAALTTGAITNDEIISGSFSIPGATTQPIVLQPPYNIPIDNTTGIPTLSNAQLLQYASGITTDIFVRFDHSAFDPNHPVSWLNDRTFFSGSGYWTVALPSAAVPEPSTAIMAAFGAVAFLAYGWSRHRRAQRRQAAA
jgi:hypothetical protein